LIFFGAETMAQEFSKNIV